MYSFSPKKRRILQQQRFVSFKASFHLYFTVYAINVCIQTNTLQVKPPSGHRGYFTLEIYAGK